MLLCLMNKLYIGGIAVLSLKKLVQISAVSYKVYVSHSLIIKHMQVYFPYRIGYKFSITHLLFPSIVTLKTISNRGFILIVGLQNLEHKL